MKNVIKLHLIKSLIVNTLIVNDKNYWKTTFIVSITVPLIEELINLIKNALETFL